MNNTMMIKKEIVLKNYNKLNVKQGNSNKITNAKV